MADDVEPYSLCINNSRAQDWVYHVVRTTTLPTVAIGMFKEWHQCLYEARTCICLVLIPWNEVQNPDTIVGILMCDSSYYFNIYTNWYIRSDAVEDLGRRKQDFEPIKKFYCHSVGPSGTLRDNQRVLNMVWARSFDARAVRQYDEKIILVHSYFITNRLTALAFSPHHNIGLLYLSTMTKEAKPQLSLYQVCKFLMRISFCRTWFPCR